MVSTAYSYYPGCSLTSSATEYDISFRKVVEALGIQLDELEDWNCCGASPAPHHKAETLGVLLPGRNLHIAGASHDAIVAPCAGCYNRLKYAQYKLAGDQDIREQTSEVFQAEVRYQTEVLNIVQMLNREITPEALRERSQGRLANIRIGAYYGCLLTRPADILGFDSPRDPRKMRPLMEATGAEVPHFPFKTECCGSYMGLARKDILLKASHRIIEVAVSTGLDALVTACPLCHQNLDLRQEQINKAMGTSLRMPVLYFSQLIGLAMGISPEELELDALVVQPDMDRWLKGVA
ncbi:succinate dehydrogenase/fumarate reductase iron-sulfur subunit [bacterium BMS3Abin01]|nr:succinate dehydrogenase/fumarate reductase iron-sulfur subunit [bacterium BMS3Abin01]HDY69523.1 heterodisulfide reductase subunit B [Actinomycetota bacterium]